MSRWPLLLLLLTLVLGGQALAVNLDQQDAAGLDLRHGELGWLRDPGGQLDLDQVRQQGADFRPLFSNLSMGYTRDVFWLRLPLHRQAGPARWWLDVGPSSLDEVTVYTLQPDGQIQRQDSGDRVPVARRQSPVADYLFPLQVPFGDSEVYLRVRTNSTMVVLARLQAADTFPATATTQYLQSGLYLGVIFTVLVLGVVYLLVWRRRLYLAYVAYLLAQLLFLLSGSGLAAQYLLPDSPHVSQRLSGFGLSMAIAFGMIFFCGLLDLPRRDRLLAPAYVVAGVATVTALAALLGYYGSFAPVMLVCLNLALLGSMPRLYENFRRGSTEQRIFIVSFAFFGVYVAGSALRGAGLIAVTDTGILVGKVTNIAHLMLLQVTIMLRSRSVEDEAETVRREAAQRQRMAAEQEQFLAMITHEIRTPLSVINAASESLRMIDPHAGQPDREQRYDRIANAIRRVDQLLDLPAGDRLAPPDKDQRVRVDVVAMTRELLAQMVDEQLGRAQLRVTRQEAWVMANPGLLQFSLLNLIDNACKYSPPDGSIELDILVVPDQQLLRWMICDQGPGVCEADRERIFEKYFRSAEHSRKPGLGLGLYLARGLVQRLGGRLNYHDRQGGGACFEIRLPLATVQHG